MMQDFKLTLVLSESQLQKLSDTNCSLVIQEHLNLQMGLPKSEYYLHQCSMKLIFSEISSCSVNVGINIFKEVLTVEGFLNLTFR